MWPAGWVPPGVDGPGRGWPSTCSTQKGVDASCPGAGMIGYWPAKAVTFIDNHDTGSSQGHWPFPEDKVMQGYARHPDAPRDSLRGKDALTIPCLFLADAPHALGPEVPRGEKSQDNLARAPLHAYQPWCTTPTPPFVCASVLCRNRPLLLSCASVLFAL